MPLIRGVARTAVIAGTATAVSGRVSRRQQARWGQQEQQQYDQQAQAAPPPAPAAPSQEEKLEQLKTLGELKASGVLTDAEFEVQKDKILHG